MRFVEFAADFPIVDDNADPLEYIQLIKLVVGGIDMDAAIKKQLLAKFENIEHLLNNDASWNSLDTEERPPGTLIAVLSKLDAMNEFVTKLIETSKGGISEIEGVAIFEMIARLRTLVQ